MCDASDPCCVSSPLGKAGCVAKGGSPSTDPCNILNPMATPGSCLASKKAGEAVTSGNVNTVGIIMIVIMGIFIVGGLVYVFFFAGSSSMGGGSRKLNIMKAIRAIKWK